MCNAVMTCAKAVQRASIHLQFCHLWLHQTRVKGKLNLCGSETILNAFALSNTHSNTHRPWQRLLKTCWSYMDVASEPKSATWQVANKNSMLLSCHSEIAQPRLSNLANQRRSQRAKTLATPVILTPYTMCLHSPAAKEFRNHCDKMIDCSKWAT